MRPWKDGRPRVPHLGQKRCRMTCLLNVYVLAAASGVFRLKLCRGTNQSSDPLREQMEQLQDRALSISPCTSNEMFPQWQLPVYVVMSGVSDLAERESAQCYDA